MLERKWYLCVCVGLTLLSAFIASCTGQSDQCASETSQRSCDSCLQAHPDCLWCQNLLRMQGNVTTETITSTIHCYNRTMYDISECMGESLEDPSSVIGKVENRMLDTSTQPGLEATQVRPQRVQMKLRRGDPQSFNMSFIALPNTPLDIYFLLDVSSSLASTINAIQSNLDAISNTLVNISSAFRIGIGGFIDKDVFPFAGTTDYSVTFQGRIECRVPGGGQDEPCINPIGYNHLLSLTDNITLFQEVLNTTSSSLGVNVDAPEAGLDALLQIAVCSDIIGWRPDSLKMVFLITDSEYHIAGDGYLAGLVRPNDGQCHMMESTEFPGQFEYEYSTLQDYPSIHQLLSILDRELIVPIFAIQQDTGGDVAFPAYTALAAELQRVQSLAIPIVRQIQGSEQTVTADTIINLISDAYQNTSQGIQVNVPSIDGYRITVEPLDCQEVTETGCRVVFGDVITFKVTVELEDCAVASNQTIQLRGAPYTFSTIFVEPECSCACSAQEFHVENSPVCTGNGTLICGACDCDDGRSGDLCECELDSGDNSCPMFDMEECGGSTRGVCSSCGECTCKEPYFGVEQGCKCNIADCSGCISTVGGGTCMCTEDSSKPTCVCNATAPLSGELFFGPNCTCNPDESCFNANWMMGQGMLCQVITDVTRSGDCQMDTGSCDAGCDCSLDTTDLPNLRALDNLCVPNNLCPYFEPCVVCRIRNTQCMSDCNAHSMYEFRSDSDDLTNYNNPPCEVRVDDCVYDFFVGRDQPFSLPVFIDQVNRVCDALPIWVPVVIAVGIVLAIIILGLLILCILKIAFVAWDKHEYKKFTQELQNADFAPHENPLYLTPQQDYQNPILRRHSSKRKQ